MRNDTKYVDYRPWRPMLDHIFLWSIYLHFFAAYSITSNLIRMNQKKLVYTRKQAAAELGISLVTLWTWTNQGILKAHSIGGRVYYKAEDILNALKQKEV